MGKTTPPASAASRLAKLGGLLGRIGLSAAGSAAAAVLRPRADDRRRSRKIFQHSARQISAAMGELKGLPMKIGQLLSLNAGFLPPEVADAFNQLQQDAPPMAFDTVGATLESELGSRFARVATLEPNPYAAASIGQVHRATLRDGTAVVFKVQYPDIDRVLEADLKATRQVLLRLLGLFNTVDLTPAIEEIAARLREEADYRQEAAFLQRMARLWRSDPQVQIPGLIRSLSTRRVLCMTFESGLSPAQACASETPRRLRNRWGRNLLRVLLTGLFTHRWLHADPNVANFSFRPDGGIILYDFGCTKRVSLRISRGYARLTRAVLAGDLENVPRLLLQIGVTQADGRQVPPQVVADYAEVLREPFDPPRVYRFTAQDSLYDRFKILGRRHWEVVRSLTIPADVVFIDRTILGHLGNLARLEAGSLWRPLIEAALESALNPADRR